MQLVVSSIRDFCNLGFIQFGFSSIDIWLNVESLVQTFWNCLGIPVSVCVVHKILGSMWYEICINMSFNFTDFICVTSLCLFRHTSVYVFAIWITCTCSFMFVGAYQCHYILWLLFVHLYLLRHISGTWMNFVVHLCSSGHKMRHISVFVDDTHTLLFPGCMRNETDLKSMEFKCYARCKG